MYVPMCPLWTTSTPYAPFSIKIDSMNVLNSLSLLKKKLSCLNFLVLLVHDSMTYIATFQYVISEIFKLVMKQLVTYLNISEKFKVVII